MLTVLPSFPVHTMQRVDYQDFSLATNPTALDLEQTQPSQQQQQQQHFQTSSSKSRPSISIMTSLPPASSMTPPHAISPSTQLPSPRNYRNSPYQWPLPVTPTRLFPITPTTGTPVLNTTDWSVKDIIESYKNDPELLKSVLKAKEEEDKRRTAEESFKAEQLRLQLKQVELEIIREYNKSGMMIPTGTRFGSGSGGPTPTSLHPPPNPFRVSSPDYPNATGASSFMAPSPSTLLPPEITHTAPPISPVTGPAYSPVYPPNYYSSAPGPQVDYNPQLPPPNPTHTIILNQPTIPNRGSFQLQQQQQQQQQQQYQLNQQSQPNPHPQPPTVQSHLPSPFPPSHPYQQHHQQDYHPQVSSPYNYGAPVSISGNLLRAGPLPVITSAPQHLNLPPTPSHIYPTSPSDYSTLSPMSAVSPHSPNMTTPKGHKRKSSSHHGFIGDKIDRSVSPSENKIKKESEDDAPKLTHNQVMEAVRQKALRSVSISSATEKSVTDDDDNASNNDHRSKKSRSPSPCIKRSPSIASPHNFPSDDPTINQSPSLTTSLRSPHLSVKSPLISPNAANVMLSPRMGDNIADATEQE